MKIIECTTEHLMELAPLFNSYRVFYRKNSDIISAHKFLEQRINNNESVIYAAQEDGKLVGFTQLYPIFSSTRMQKLWLLNDLYIDSAYRGKGISKLLLKRAEILAKETNAAGLILETEKNNVLANKLYANSGWELDTEHNYYFLESKS